MRNTSGIGDMLIFLWSYSLLGFCIAVGEIKNIANESGICYSSYLPPAGTTYLNGKLYINLALSIISGTDCCAAINTIAKLKKYIL